MSAAAVFLPVIAACSSNISRQPVTKVDPNDGLKVVIDWIAHSPGDGSAFITFTRESFVRLRREGIVRGTFDRFDDPNAIFIFSARTIGSGINFDAMFGFKNEREARDMWEKDFYDLNTDVVNTFETRWNNNRFISYTLNAKIFAPDGTKSNPRIVREG